MVVCIQLDLLNKINYPYLNVHVDKLIHNHAAVVYINRNKSYKKSEFSINITGFNYLLSLLSSVVGATSTVPSSSSLEEHEVLEKWNRVNYISFYKVYLQ